MSSFDTWFPNNGPSFLFATVFIFICWAYSARSQSVGNLPQAEHRILFISLELADPLFSGNGVYARTILEALLFRLPQARILALCGLPSDPSRLVATPVHAGSIFPGAATSLTSRLTVATTTLSTWRSLDRSCDWRGFEKADTFQELSKSFHPTHVVFVDWTGARLALNLQFHTQPRLVFLNFRVFSSNRGASRLSANDKLFYSNQEKSAVLFADTSIALCPADADALKALALPIRAQVSVLNPPLRSDLWALALNKEAPWRVERGQRQWLLCCTRISPEKNVELFVDALAQPGMCTALRKLGITPRLVGSGPDADYVEKIRGSLISACPFAVIGDFVQGDPVFLARLFSETALNFHPSLYEAFGMTVLEAAAFGAPSLFDGGGNIGVASLLRPEKGEALTACLDSNAGCATFDGHRDACEHQQTRGAQAASLAIISVLSDGELLENTGNAARARSLEWNVENFATNLASMIFVS
jgi:glycosyltransferase involved in cell wall biosynthesis